MMTASNLKLFFPYFQGHGWNDAPMNPALLLDAFLCVTLQIQSLSDLRHIEQETARLHLYLISYWLRPSSKWHIKLLDYCCRYWTKKTDTQ